MQFSKISSNVYNGDRDTLFNWYGTNFQAEDGTQLDRDLGDGEKNAGFVDWDGRWTKDKFSFFFFRFLVIFKGVPTNFGQNGPSSSEVKRKHIMKISSGWPRASIYFTQGGNHSQYRLL